MNLRNVVIASATRTAGGSFGGSLKNHTCVDLGALAIKSSVTKAGIDSTSVDQIIMGNGWQAGVGPNPARIAGIMSGLPQNCPAFTINIRCGSGLRAVQLGALSIAAGEADIVVAGGMESASNVPYIAADVRWGARMGDKALQDLLHKDGFMCPLAGMMMGSTGELLAEKYSIDKQEQNEYALASHEKAIAAIKSGVFKEEIIPIDVVTKQGSYIFETDEIPKEGTSLDKMAKLSSIFKKDGTVTAANSSALCDAASALVLIEENKAKTLGVNPLAKVLSYSYIALDPLYMGEGPIRAIKKALDIANLSLNDIDLFELNEAFAVQVLACNRVLRIDPTKINIYGGAIALGHPIGATGAKLLTTLAYSLKRCNKKYGLVALCIGGGQGVALIIEKI